MRVESTPAIVLRTREFGESDKIVTVLSRSAGKFSGIAKGAKRSQRRFPGTLEIFSHVQLDYRRRPHAELAFLERATFLSPWPRLLDSLERFTAASHVVELADKMTIENEVGDELYGVVAATLARLNAAEPGPATLRLFELAALSTSGYRPELVHCRGCRRALAGERGPIRLVVSLGGLLCAACRSQEEGGMLVSPAALECLGMLQTAVDRGVARGNGAGPVFDPYGDEPTIALRLQPRVAREVAMALDLLLTPHLRGRLRSLELLGPVLRDDFSEPDER